MLALPLVALLLNHFLAAVRTAQVHNLVVVEDQLHKAADRVKLRLV